MNQQLAVVIPAYKPNFIRETLQSFLDQTDQRFNVYIGDDSSPFHLEKLIKELHLPPHFHYHHFKENLGQKSLVEQWERCINLTNGETWIWLFSDDDIAEKHCVESFYKAKAANPQTECFRFNSRKVDADGNLIRTNQFPNSITAADFLNIKLSYSHESYIVEGVFSKKAFHEIGGFPKLPLAWAADDLFWTKMADRNPIITIENAFIDWRYSGHNISSKKENGTSMLKLKAARQFIRWIFEHSKLVTSLNPSDLPASWYIRQLRNLRKDLTLFQELYAVFAITSSDFRVWKYYIQLVKDQSRIIGWIKRFLS